MKMNFFKDQNKKAFGSVASTMIMFIAIVGVSLGMVMSFQNYVVDTQDALSTQKDITSNKLRSAISISNIFYNSTSNDLNIYVKNIGEVQMTTEFFDLFVDGKFYNTFDVVYASNLSKNMTLLIQQDMMVIIHNDILTSGTHEVKVATEFGTSDSESFNI